MIEGVYDASHPSVSLVYKRNAATILARIHFLLQTPDRQGRHEVRSWRNRLWVRWTAEDLHHHFPDLGLKTIKRALQRLRGETGLPAALLFARLRTYGRAYWFAIDYDILKRIQQESSQHARTRPLRRAALELVESRRTGRSDSVDAAGLTPSMGSKSPSAASQKGPTKQKEENEKDAATINGTAARAAGADAAPGRASSPASATVTADIVDSSSSFSSDSVAADSSTPRQEPTAPQQAQASPAGGSEAIEEKAEAPKAEAPHDVRFQAEEHQAPPRGKSSIPGLIEGSSAHAQRRQQRIQGVQQALMQRLADLGVKPASACHALILHDRRQCRLQCKFWPHRPEASRENYNSGEFLVRAIPGRYDPPKAAWSRHIEARLAQKVAHEHAQGLEIKQQERQRQLAAEAAAAQQHEDEMLAYLSKLPQAVQERLEQGVPKRA